MPVTTVAPEARPELPPSMVERMTLILDEFAARTTRLTLEEVGRRTHLPRSTAHRILDQLVKLRWLDHTSFGYCLGRRSLSLGGRGDDDAEVRQAAAPLLHQLSVQTGLVVHLAVLDEVEIVYLDKVGGRFAAAVPSRVGGRAPAHSTALGKAMLAWLQPEDVEERFSSELRRQTHVTIGEVGLLHQELNRIRARRGVAFERGECFSHISCVAAAIRGPEGPLAAISLVGDSRAPLEKVAPLVAAAAHSVSLELFPQVRESRGARRKAMAGQQNYSAATMERLAAAGQSGSHWG
ncbi:Transcriptional regulator, IclR family [Alloactinosynnema sp. L-07]|uniref:IclR family transcriptional regulator n=1 Tax=Alloactinosynnema sp. L-07 TaxID=1653480 RepID=UPI00065EF811|nr:IclR family transcriptional regulator [Alloactinosynnema sp. L-07]CRK57821.1 Transcriptional regulator, IclR family [Alloactinosynnema sp. L-07]